MRKAEEHKIFGRSIVRKKKRAEVTLASIGDAVICSEQPARVIGSGIANRTGKRQSEFIPSTASPNPMSICIRIFAPSDLSLGTLAASDASNSVA